MRRFLAILSLLSLANLTTARLGLACEMESAPGQPHAAHDAAAPLHDMAMHAGHQADQSDERAVPADEDGSGQAGCLMMAQCAVVLAQPAPMSRAEFGVASQDVMRSAQPTPSSAQLEQDVPPPRA